MFSFQLSILDWNPNEIVYLEAKKIEIKIEKSNSSVVASLEMGDLQIDNNLKFDKQKVIFSRKLNSPQASLGSRSSKISNILDGASPDIGAYEKSMIYAKTTIIKSASEFSYIIKNFKFSLVPFRVNLDGECFNALYPIYKNNESNILLTETLNNSIVKAPDNHWKSFPTFVIEKLRISEIEFVLAFQNLNLILEKKINKPRLNHCKIQY